MEEWETRRNVAAEEGDQPSRKSGQTGPGPGAENWLLSVEDAEERTHQSQTQWGKIAKVPQMLRRIQDFEKFYEAMLLCARRFLDESHQFITLFYSKIESNIELLRIRQTSMI
ncbi:hypothetical protein PVL29_010753 [Vitis rotundifolia]|uniref:Uncharacterized protein n=1 Tax=Vitis rotundifolia TaxID=103349 RepID=A0AA39DSJ8_VITRO|nr:hypothetical protein PVL29_010753 [Vitis rotundifolia]